MVDKQYVKRDGDAEEYVLWAPEITSVRDVRIARAAFNAGWEARKRAEYESIIERATTKLKPLVESHLAADCKQLAHDEIFEETATAIAEDKHG